MRFLGLPRMCGTMVKARRKHPRGGRANVSVAMQARLPDELREIRRRAGLTRKVLAELAGLSDGTIRLIEAGTSQPRAETLRLLAKGLATKRLTGDVDAEQHEALYRRLLDAAGLLPEPAHDGDALPPDITAHARELMSTDEGMFRALLAGLARLPDNASRRRALRFLGEALDYAAPLNGGRRSARN